MTDELTMTAREAGNPISGTVVNPIGGTAVVWDSSPAQLPDAEVLERLASAHIRVAVARLAAAQEQTARLGVFVRGMLLGSALTASLGALLMEILR